MRELIEKQEKLIATHRTKIAEISKQFRDLEMVHNRVVKDLEMKNQQFIMPVKITRAVGLQVLIPKRSEHASNSSSKSMPSTPATPISSKTINSPATPAAPSNDSAKRSRTSEVTAPEPAKRIRCNQKVTPLRPDTPQRTMLNNAKVPPTLSPATPTNSTQSQQSTPTNSNKQPMAFKTVIRNVVPSQQGLTPPQGGGTQTASQIQLVERVTQISNNSQVTSNTAARKSVTPKPGQQQQNTSQKSTQNNFQTSPERPRVPPVILKKTTNGRSLTVANPQTNSPSQGTNTGSNTIPNKSVIDLTDEDDKPTVDSVNPPALVAIPQNSKPAAHTQAQNRVTTYVISKPQTQRVSTTQNGTIRASPKTSYVPIAPKPSAQATQAGLNQRATPTNTAAANSAAPKRASVPAPLPKPPNVPSNPLWKAPPSRPSIRINNIDTGIVISWTMDDMTADYAEVTSYQIYAYQESSAPPQVESWRHEGQRYFFAVRAIDEHSRYGPFSMPKTWS
ncbi:unnamed protein product [Hermetia illucens]|uniref:Activating transcription factor 7-interacting protein Fn3 domain-containing protein n=1 Tax=Hermetia illucens TaxID=343691 RepID=A0A7R8UB18_HERIL|nr:unnamed protein product [Hermetia illucens]